MTAPGKPTRFPRNRCFGITVEEIKWEKTRRKVRAEVIEIARAEDKAVVFASTRNRVEGAFGHCETEETGVHARWLDFFELKLDGYR